MPFANRTVRITALVLLLTGPLISQATVHYGVEPNQNKLEVTLLTGIAPGDRIVPGVGIGVQPNYLRLQPTPLPVGIYRHELNHLVGLRGQLIVIGRDAATELVYPLSTGDVQRSGTQGTDYFLTWYGFGKSEEVVVDLAGGGAFRGGPLTFEHSVWPVLENDLGFIGESDIVVSASGGTVALGDLDLQIFDADFNAVPHGGRHHAPNQTGVALRSTLPAGEYHIAVSDQLLATHLPPGPADPQSTTVVLDYAGAVCGGSAEVGRSIVLSIRAGPSPSALLREFTAVKRKHFEVIWFRLVVGASQSVSSFCAGDGVLSTCPCGTSAPLNSGMGCVNSTGRGATAIVGRPSGQGAGMWRVTLEDLPASTIALAFASLGTAGPGNVGGGLLCLDHGAVRFGPFSAGINGTAVINIGGLPTHGLPLGQSVYLQAAYRDMAAPPGCQLNLTSGYRFVPD